MLFLGWHPPAINSYISPPFTLAWDIKQCTCKHYSNFLHIWLYRVQCTHSTVGRFESICAQCRHKWGQSGASPEVLCPSKSFGFQWQVRDDRISRFGWHDRLQDPAYLGGWIARLQDPGTDTSGSHFEIEVFDPQQYQRNISFEQNTPVIFFKNTFPVFFISSLFQKSTCAVFMWPLMWSPLFTPVTRYYFGSRRWMIFSYFKQLNVQFSCGLSGDRHG